MRRLTLVLLALASACSAAEVTSNAIHEAASKTVRLIQASQVNWYAKQSCSSCHNQLLPALAFHAARQSGIPVDEAAARAEAAKTFHDYADLDRAVQYTHLIDIAMDDAFRLVAADAAGVKPGLATAVYARLIATRQQPDGQWLTTDMRPPQSNSQISATAFCLRALQIYGHGSLAADTRNRVARARAWLLSQKPRNTEDAAYQLFGLSWAGAPASDMAPLAKELAAAQRDDGGWNSVAGRPSDAYSTSEALVALYRAAGLSPNDPVWARGLQFLLDTQKPDGSWHVASRQVSPVQVSPPYFESGHPYGHDQYISLMGASWAVMAFAEALGSKNTTPEPALTAAAPSDVEPWVETMLFGSATDVEKLLASGFDPNSATKGGTTALMLAMPDVEKARLLLARGANVNARAKTRYSALLVAAQYSDSTPAIRLLLDHGAQLQLPKGAGKPLFNATGLTLSILSGNTSAIPLFVSRGDRFDDAFWFIGLFPDPAAVNIAASGDLRTMKVLLDAGLPVDMAAPDGVTLLGQAVLANRVDMAKLLISRGADVNRVDSYGLTPFLLAASVDYGDSAMIDLLRKSGAKIETRNKEGRTALELARKYQHANVLPSLQPGAE